MEFRERFWDESPQEYEAKQTHWAEDQIEKRKYRIYLVGWEAGVPDEILEEVESNLG